MEKPMVEQAMKQEVTRKKQSNWQEVLKQQLQQQPGKDNYGAEQRAYEAGIVWRPGKQYQFHTNAPTRFFTDTTEGVRELQAAMAGAGIPEQGWLSDYDAAQPEHDHAQLNEQSWQRFLQEKEAARSHAEYEAAYSRYQTAYRANAETYLRLVAELIVRCSVETNEQPQQETSVS